ncbi:hypothetical protein LWI29_015917 [Acer saccharum]|uniref:Uncharacterized protein n=1 Tax=Acer saccharum TaxID=4024 RepID=A0AA39RYX8_ACESA|nr:hypothetical protein LWI29_015917 [Acer saccharum]
MAGCEEREKRVKCYFFGIGFVTMGDGGASGGLLGLGPADMAHNADSPTWFKDRENQPHEISGIHRDAYHGSQTVEGLWKKPWLKPHLTNRDPRSGESLELIADDTVVHQPRPRLRPREERPF